MEDKVIHVLSIEDNPADARLIQEMLAEASGLGWNLPRFEVAHVARLAAGLARLDAGDIDVVLSDLDLPDSRAGETFAQVHAHAPEVPIVVLTGRDDEVLARRTVRAGAEDYLFKREMSGALLAHALIYALERQRSKRALRETHDEAAALLERRVAERTAQLERVNQVLTEQTQALRESEAFLQTVYDHSPVGIFVVDVIAPGEYVYQGVNPAHEQILGVSDDFIQGQSPHALEAGYGKETVAYILDLYDTCLQRRQPLKLEEKVDWGGQAVTLLTQITPLFDANDEVYRLIGTVLDITARVQAETRLRTRLRYERNLALLSTTLLESLSLDDDMASALGYLQDAADVARVYIFENFTDAQGGLCMCQVYESHAPDVEPQIDNPALWSLPYAEGFERWADVLARGQPICGAIAEFPPAERAVLAPQGIQSILVLPIRVGGAWWGFIGFDETRRVRLWHDDDVRLLQTAAEIIGRFLERFLAEEVLQASEEKYRGLVEQSLQGLVIAQDNPVRIVFASQPMQTISGFAPQELQGFGPQQLANLIHPDHRETFFQNFRARLQGQAVSPRHEYQIIHKGGAVRWIELYSSIITYEGALATQTLFMDITARKQAEGALVEQAQALRESKSQLQAILTHAPAIIYIKDPQGRFVLVNPAFEAAFDVPRAQILGKPASELIPAEAAAEHEANDAQVMQSGQAFQFQESAVQADGQMHTVISVKFPIRDAEGQIYGVGGISTDITARVRAESAAQARLRIAQASAQASLQELMQVALDEIESLTGSEIGFYHFFHADQAIISLQTWSTNTLKNLCGAEGQGHHYPLSQAGVWADCIRERRPVIHNDYAALPHRKGMPPGHAPVIRELVLPIMRGGQVVAVLGVGNKPTDYDEQDIEIATLLGEFSWEIVNRKRAEEALAHYADELERSNKALQQFAYVISHDLQEPLRMVQGYLDLLTRRYGDQLDADAQEYVAYVVDGAARMQDMIRALLRLSRVETHGGTFAPTDLKAALARAQQALARTIEESGARVTHDALPTVLADEAQLVQVFQNLIANGIKFCRQDEPPRVHISARRRGDQWVLSVADNGIGIDPRQAERLFQIFQRLHTREEYPGTGIGLALCQRIVARHGGKIWVESQVGEGATFYFTLPVMLSGD
jgi:PAS domain S-box-containing protein